MQICSRGTLNHKERPRKVEMEGLLFPKDCRIASFLIWDVLKFINIISFDVKIKMLHSGDIWGNLD